MPRSAVVSEQGAGVQYAVLDRGKPTEAKVKLCEGFLIWFHFMGLKRERVLVFLKPVSVNPVTHFMKKTPQTLSLCLNVVCSKYS